MIGTQSLLYNYDREPNLWWYNYDREPNLWWYNYDVATRTLEDLRIAQLFAGQERLRL